MEARGVKVDALADKPTMLDIDYFYLRMHDACKDNLPSIFLFCKLHKMTVREVAEASRIMTYIERRT